MRIKTIVMYCDNCPGEITFEAKDVDVELDLTDSTYIFQANCRGCGIDIITRRLAFVNNEE